MIEVKVKLNSFLRVAIGLPEVTVKLEEHATLLDLVKKLSAEHGDAVRNNLIDSRTGAVKVLFSRNRMKATKDQRLCEGDVVAIFPPLAGG